MYRNIIIILLFMSCTTINIVQNNNDCDPQEDQFCGKVYQKSIYDN